MSTDGLPGPSTSTSPDARPRTPRPRSLQPRTLQPRTLRPGSRRSPARPRSRSAHRPRSRPVAEPDFSDGLRRDERGEGVISAAIAVLIMAFVGVAAFVAYRGIMGSVTEKTTECVDVYVSNGSGCD